MHVDHPAALADFEDQGVGGHEGAGADIKQAGTERPHGGAELFDSSSGPQYGDPTTSGDLPWWSPMDSGRRRRRFFCLAYDAIGGAFSAENRAFHPTGAE